MLHDIIWYYIMLIFAISSSNVPNTMWPWSLSHPKKRPAPLGHRLHSSRPKWRLAMGWWRGSMVTGAYWRSHSDPSRDIVLSSQANVKRGTGFAIYILLCYGYLQNCLFQFRKSSIQCWEICDIYLRYVYTYRLNIVKICLKYVLHI